MTRYLVVAAHHFALDIAQIAWVHRGFEMRADQ
jgi:hypothetical protein